MNKSIYDAVSGINEIYLSQSEDFEAIKKEFKKSRAKKIRSFSLICTVL